MSKTAKIDVKDNDISSSINAFLIPVLAQEDVGAILVPTQLPMKQTIMPTLITDPERLKEAAPLSPSFPMNAAKVVSRLSRKPIGEKVVAVLRPCEIRAFVELVKLHQGQWDELIVIGIDCPGAFDNRDYLKFAEKEGEGAVKAFIDSALSSKEVSFGEIELMSACKSCEHPVPEGADVLIGLYGIDTQKELLVKSQSEAGDQLLENLNLPDFTEPPSRKSAVEELLAARVAHRDEMIKETIEKTDTLEKLTTYLADCVNCYNCRVACPVCYCKECVFVTDVFNHEPAQYLGWAKRKGAIKMPTDTVFYHITRMAHMSTACVGCGQCSNACPNDIPVVELFRCVAQTTQHAFGYEAGRSIEEKPPLSVFKENELQEIVGVK